MQLYSSAIGRFQSPQLVLGTVFHIMSRPHRLWLYSKVAWRLISSVALSRDFITPHLCSACTVTLVQCPGTHYRTVSASRRVMTTFQTTVSNIHWKHFSLVDIDVPSAVEVFTTLRYVNVHLLTYLLTVRHFGHLNHFFTYLLTSQYPNTLTYHLQWATEHSRCVHDCALYKSTFTYLLIGREIYFTNDLYIVVITIYIIFIFNIESYRKYRKK